MAFRHFAQIVHASRQAMVAAVLSGSVISTSMISAQDIPADIDSQVQAHLDAGEFGPALESLKGVEDQQKRSELLKQVADAQMQLGEFDSAYYAIRRMPERDSRNEAHRERSQKNELAGGALIPDFTRLMNLIQLAVRDPDSPWDDGAAVDENVGTMEGDFTGVSVDPNGLMRTLSEVDRAGRLKALGLKAREASLNGDLAKPSQLRLVSLTRLEKEVARLAAEGRPVVTSMKHLAGLTKIQYVFVYPEENEIVIGGPAEPWRYNEEGQPVGVSNGRPMLQLDDLVTVFRTFSHDGAGTFNCLIVPRKEGLKAVSDFVAASNAGGPLAPGQVKGWTQELQNKLGVQDVEVNGIPVDSRVARVIVEADYRMKLIGIGKLDPVDSIPSFFELLSKTREQNLTSIDALRWWMTMKYDAISHSPDREAFEIKGSSVQCLSENEFVTAQGERIPTRKAEKTNSLFASLFTEHYDELAKADPIFADMQNIFDLSLVAALIQSEGLAQRAEWNGGAFAPGGQYETRTYAAPKTVMSAVNHKVYNQRNIVVQVAGGVKGDFLRVANDPALQAENAALENVEQSAAAPALPAGRWWWDAK
ncbi:MAG: DUF1598 domain-containing protein [Planctomycetaceae bacterium]|nr:DUF1598 domain-containing protein [Planctomycetaceae bacterium]